MAGNDDADAILPVGVSDGTLGARRADGASQLLVRAGFAIRDLEEAVPDRFLKWTARVNQRHSEPGQLAVEVPGQFLLELVEVFVFARYDGALEAAAQRLKLRLQHAAVGELNKANSPGDRAGDNWSKGALYPGDDNAVGIATASRRLAERARKGLAKTAG